MAQLSIVTAAVLLACVLLAQAADPFKCPKIKSEDVCNDEDDCSWCVSRSVGTGCYPAKVIKMLPKKYFDCDKEPVEGQREGGLSRAQAAGASKVQRIARLDGDECDNRSEGDCISPACVWCTSAAVGGACYTPEQAKLLPSAIFKCKTAPSA